MSHRIGVFLCRCVDNISGFIDLDAIRAELESLPSVAFVSEQELLCSPEGKAQMESTMRDAGATHAVVAACSPRDHEQTFRGVLARAGVNPYLLQLANIREHCTWITADRERAQEKALAMTKAALRRVVLHEALSEKEIEANPDLLVIGGGIAGIEAALMAAAAGRKVTVVEASPTLGGRVPAYEELAPNLECGPCMIAPRLSEIDKNESIDIITNAEVEQIVGYLGNFTATVRRKPRLVAPELCLGCDECMEACPVEAPDAFNQGMSKRKAISIPFPGSVPNCAVIDPQTCLRFQGESCSACALACPMEALDFEQQEEVVEVPAGAVVLATGFEPFDPAPLKRLGYGSNPAVYTSSEVERLLSSGGPTEGRFERRDGVAPKTVAVLHCVGRTELGYCSGVCCQTAFKLAPMLTAAEQQCEVVHLHTDLVAPGRSGAMMQQKARDAGARFLQISDPATTRVEPTDGGACLRYHNAAGSEEKLEADMVVLVTGLGPSRGTEHFAEMLDLVLDDSGFPAADHPSLRTAQSSLDGVFLAGCIAGPKSIAESVASAQAATGLALSRIQPGKKLTVEVLTAEANTDLCSRCLLCLSACPYHAITYDAEADRVEVVDVLCRGCGTCVAACASGAAKARHFTDRQIYSEIEEVLND